MEHTLVDLVRLMVGYREQPGGTAPFCRAACLACLCGDGLSLFPAVADAVAVYVEALAFGAGSERTAGDRTRAVAGPKAVTVLHLGCSPDLAAGALREADL